MNGTVTPPVDGNSNPIENDKITFFAGMSLVGQNLTFEENSAWDIASVGYTNLADVTINIPFTTAGLNRTDIFVFNTSNTIVRVPGVSSNTNPVAPAVPQDTVYATFVTVTDNSISTPEPAITDGLYRKKIEKGCVLLSTDALTSILVINQKSSYKLNGTSPFFTHLFNQNLNSPLYDGRENTIICNQVDGTILKHNSALYPGNALAHRFWFKDGQDLVLKLGDIAVIKYIEQANRYELVSLNASASKKTQIIQFAWNGANYSANTNWWHLTPFTPKYGTSFTNNGAINVTNAFADDNNYGFRESLMFDGKIKAITVEGDNNGVNWNCDFAIRNFELYTPYNAGFSVGAHNNQIVARKQFIVGSGNNQRRTYFDAITDFGDLLLPKNSVIKPYFKSEGVDNSNWQMVVLTILIEEV